jgi:hypothetical protein
VLVVTTDIIAILALSIGLAALLAAIAIIIYIVRWKTAFVIEDGDKKFQLVPDDVISQNTSELKKQRKASKQVEKFHTELVQKAINHHEEIGRTVISSNEELRKDQRRVVEAHQLTLEAVSSLQEETKILRGEIQTQAEELQRHRKGYDVDILSIALIPVARMHRMIQEDLDRDVSNEARATLEALEDEHLEILETRGVKLIEPPVGALYRDQQNVKHPPDSFPATEQSDIGTIKSVSSPAYELETSARNVVLLEAEVVVYTVSKETLEPESTSAEECDNG